MITINKNLIILIAFFSSLIVLALFPNKYTLVFAPILNSLIIFSLYKEEIKNYNYNGFLNAENTNIIYCTMLSLGLFLQYGANFFVNHYLNIFPPNIDFAYKVIVAPVTAIILSGINEEIIYRRILFKYFEGKSNFWIGAIVSSVIFAFSHYNYAGWLGYFAVGIVWCYAYKKSGSLLMSILIHITVNFAFFLRYSMINN